MILSKNQPIRFTDFDQDHSFSLCIQTEITLKYYLYQHSYTPKWPIFANIDFSRIAPKLRFLKYPSVLALGMVYSSPPVVFLVTQKNLTSPKITPCRANGNSFSPLGALYSIKHKQPLHFWKGNEM